jgi:hypothetical protein
MSRSLTPSSDAGKTVIDVYNRLATTGLFIHCLVNVVIIVIFRPTGFSAPGGGMLVVLHRRYIVRCEIKARCNISKKVTKRTQQSQYCMNVCVT